MTDYAEEAPMGESPSVTKLRRLLKEAAEEITVARERIAQLEAEEVCPRTAGDQVLDDGTPAALEVCVQCWRDYKDKKRKRKYRE